MMDMLARLDYRPMWSTLISCLKSCAAYLEVDCTLPWLYGASGHAFVLNIHHELCPSGPTAWDKSGLFTQVEALGLKVSTVQGHKVEPAFADRQVEAFRVAHAAIAAGRPCFAWELEVPEFYLITACDEIGYYYSGPGCEKGAGPLPWNKLGATEIGYLAVHEVESAPAQPAAVIVKRALEFAATWADPQRNEWRFQPYTAGPAAYTTWIEALRNGTAGGHGNAYNAQVWAECRRQAVSFLEEARLRLHEVPEELFSSPLTHYRSVAGHLRALTALFPFVNVTEEERAANAREPHLVASAIDHLTAAREAEERALQGLTILAEAIEG